MEKAVVVKLMGLGKVCPPCPEGIELHRMDDIILESDSGLFFGTVKSAPSEPAFTGAPESTYRIVRKATEEDLMQVERNSEKGNEAFGYCHDKIAQIGLNMKLVSVDYLFDGSKIVFNFTADERVDFRELVKTLASRFHTRVEMKQIGVRDEAKIKGGIGSCGRVLCCSTWITRFEPVSVKMAKAQGLSLNPTNISGMCGRLMCCLSYEYKNYLGSSKPSSRMPGTPYPEGKKETEVPADLPLEKTVRGKDQETPADSLKKPAKKSSAEKDTKIGGKKHRRRKRRPKGKKKEE